MIISTERKRRRNVMYRENEAEIEVAAESVDVGDDDGSTCE